MNYMLLLQMSSQISAHKYRTIICTFKTIWHKAELFMLFLPLETHAKVSASYEGTAWKGHEFPN